MQKRAIEHVHEGAGWCQRRRQPRRGWRRRCGTNWSGFCQADLSCSELLSPRLHEAAWLTGGSTLGMSSCKKPHGSKIYSSIIGPTIIWRDAGSYVPRSNSRACRLLAVHEESATLERLTLPPT